jgi:D-3-phosphoglycerate dehydrogenase
MLPFQYPLATKEIVEAGSKLQIIGAAGVGVDNIDVPAATRQGIIVVNSPEGNTICRAEHALAMMLSLPVIFPMPISQ